MANNIIMIGICIVTTSIALIVWFLEKGIKTAKIRIAEWKTDEGWSYEKGNDYKTIGYQVFIDNKVDVIEIKNQNASRVLILR